MYAFRFEVNIEMRGIMRQMLKSIHYLMPLSKI